MSKKSTISMSPGLTLKTRGLSPSYRTKARSFSCLRKVLFATICSLPAGAVSVQLRRASSSQDASARVLVEQQRPSTGGAASPFQQPQVEDYQHRGPHPAPVFDQTTSPHHLSAAHLRLHDAHQTQLHNSTTAQQQYILQQQAEQLLAQVVPAGNMEHAIQFIRQLEFTMQHLQPGQTKEYALLLQKLTDMRQQVHQYYEQQRDHEERYRQIALQQAAAAAANQVGGRVENTRLEPMQSWGASSSSAHQGLENHAALYQDQHQHATSSPSRSPQIAPTGSPGASPSCTFIPADTGGTGGTSSVAGFSPLLSQTVSATPSPQITATLPPGAPPGLESMGGGGGPSTATPSGAAAFDAPHQMLLPPNLTLQQQQQYCADAAAAAPLFAAAVAAAGAAGEQQPLATAGITSGTPTAHAQVKAKQQGDYDYTPDPNLALAHIDGAAKVYVCVCADNDPKEELQGGAATGNNVVTENVQHTDNSQPSKVLEQLFSASSAPVMGASPGQHSSEYQGQLVHDEAGVTAPSTSGVVMVHETLSLEQVEQRMRAQQQEQQQKQQQQQQFAQQAEKRRQEFNEAIQKARSWWQEHQEKEKELQAQQTSGKESKVSDAALNERFKQAYANSLSRQMALGMEVIANNADAPVAVSSSASTAAAGPGLISGTGTTNSVVHEQLKQHHGNHLFGVLDNQVEHQQQPEPPTSPSSLNAAATQFTPGQSYHSSVPGPPPAHMYHAATPAPGAGASTATSSGVGLSHLHHAQHLPQPPQHAPSVPFLSGIKGAGSMNAPAPTSAPSSPLRASAAPYPGTAAASRASPYPAVQQHQMITNVGSLAPIGQHHLTLPPKDEDMPGKNKGGQSQFKRPFELVEEEQEVVEASPSRWNLNAFMAGPDVADLVKKSSTASTAPLQPQGQEIWHGTTGVPPSQVLVHPAKAEADKANDSWWTGSEANPWGAGSSPHRRKTSDNLTVATTASNSTGEVLTGGPTRAHHGTSSVAPAATAQPDRLPKMGQEVDHEDPGSGLFYRDGIINPEYYETFEEDGRDDEEAPIEWADWHQEDEESELQQVVDPALQAGAVDLVPWQTREPKDWRQKAQRESAQPSLGSTRCERVDTSKYFDNVDVALFDHGAALSAFNTTSKGTSSSIPAARQKEFLLPVVPALMSSSDQKTSTSSKQIISTTTTTGIEHRVHNRPSAGGTSSSSNTRSNFNLLSSSHHPTHFYCPTQTIDTAAIGGSGCCNYASKSKTMTGDMEAQEREMKADILCRLLAEREDRSVLHSSWRL
ncbi:unnamed protein product [Amoebophrya sp. A120]|nr:unnamed protein product [Amoebophrya sp. A120]|eukprot:GSA120T00001197001.1